MKEKKEHSLLYHTMHSRPMPGCLPLFFLIAVVVVGVGIWFAPVRMPEPVRPEGVGRVSIKKDRLTDFVLRRKSPLPLHLPLHADPEFQEDIAQESMALLRPVRLQTPPPIPLFEESGDSAVLDKELLLALPPAEAAQSSPAETPQQEDAEYPLEDEDYPETQSSSAAEPVFHPGVERESDRDREEVRP